MKSWELKIAEVEGRRGFSIGFEEGPIFFGPVVPEDQSRLRRGLGELSPQSRYLRFFSPVTQLTDQQIEYFTHPDQENHIAWGALAMDEPGFPGIGLGRIHRDVENATRAEIAIAVVDRWQSRGVGTVLMATLCAAAMRHGIEEFEALILRENGLVLEWFARLGAVGSNRGDHWEVRLPVKRVVEEGPEGIRGLIEEVGRRV